MLGLELWKSFRIQLSPRIAYQEETSQIFRISKSFRRRTSYAGRSKQIA